jgi:ADP-heptose:LPS heptosyltransferase
MLATLRRRDTRILFIRLGAVGDVVRTLPALTLVRRRLPDATLAWLVEERSLPVLRLHPDLDETILFPRDAFARELASPDGFFDGVARAAGLVRELRRREFTASLDFQGTFKSGLCAFAAGAPLRAGYERCAVKEGNHLFSNARVALPSGPVHRVRRNLALLRAIGIDAAPEDEAPAPLPISPEDREAADRALCAAGATGAPFVFLYPGSSARQSWKRYPANRLGEVARHLIDGGIEVVVAPGPGEESIIATMRASAGPTLRILPATSLMAMAEVIRRSRLFLGGDTGPMHIAAAQGVPVVALFGPTDPALNAPLGAGHVVLDALDPRRDGSSEEPTAPPAASGAHPGRPVRRPHDPSVFDALPPGEIARAALARTRGILILTRSQ